MCYNRANINSIFLENIPARHGKIFHYRKKVIQNSKVWYKEFDKL